MATSSLDDLLEVLDQVRARPGIVYESARGMSLGDLQATMAGVRGELARGVSSAPDTAFERQPEDAGGEPQWSVGEILGHCNRAVHDIGSRALSLLDVEAGEPPAELKRWSEIQVIPRDAAEQAVNAVDIASIYGQFPDGADLDASAAHDFFGAMSARSWLYFMAVHEADHVRQIQRLG